MDRTEYLDIEGIVVAEDAPFKTFEHMPRTDSRRSATSYTLKH